MWYCPGLWFFSAMTLPFLFNKSLFTFWSASFVFKTFKGETFVVIIQDGLAVTCFWRNNDLVSDKCIEMLGKLIALSKNGEEKESLPVVNLHFFIGSDLFCDLRINHKDIAAQHCLITSQKNKPVFNSLFLMFACIVYSFFKSGMLYLCYQYICFPLSV